MESLIRSVYGRADAEYVIKKSRFIATVCEVKSEDEASAFIDEVKKKYWDARHNCSAYQVGPDGRFQRSSDDGEPAGTAGRPILEVLKKQGLTNTAIVVTRYFGGIKLGASGLIRAYSHAAALGLEAADIAVYPLVSTMERFVPDHGGTITDRQFAADVTFTMEVPQNEAEPFAAALTDTTSGRVTCQKTGTLVKPVVSG